MEATEQIGNWLSRLFGCAQGERAVGPAGTLKVKKRINIFDPELLSTLITVAEMRSFTEAARLLGRSQSTVSASIGRLEELVGCQLVSRTTHSVVFTTNGEEMVRYARLVIDLSDEALRRFSQHGGVVRLGLFTDFSSPALTDVLVAFNRRYPSAQVIVETNRSDILMSRLRDGALDLALVTRLPGHAFGPPLWQDDLVWIGKREVPKSVREPIALAVRVRPAMLRRIGVEALNVAQRSHVVTFEGNTYTAIAAAVDAGFGFSVFPRSMRPLHVPIIDDGSLPSLGRIDIVLLKSENKQREEVIALQSIIHAHASQLSETAAASMFGDRSNGPVVARVV